MTDHIRLFPLAIAALAAALLLILLPNAAGGQAATGPPCGNRTHVVDLLHKHYGERLVSSGLSHAGTVYEVYAGLAGDWTIIVSNASGESCLVASGEAWESRRWPELSVSGPPLRFEPGDGAR